MLCVRSCGDSVQKEDRRGGTQHLTDKEITGNTCITSSSNLIWVVAIRSKVQGVSGFYFLRQTLFCSYKLFARPLSLSHNILLPVGSRCFVNVFLMCLWATFVIYCRLTSSHGDSQAPPASVGAIQYNNIKFELQFSELLWQSLTAPNSTAWYTNTPTLSMLPPLPSPHSQM